MSKSPHNDPRRVESPARVRVAEEAPSPPGPLMRVAETAPPEFLRDGERDVTWIDPRGTFAPQVTAVATRDANGRVTDAAVAAPHVFLGEVRPWHSMETAHQDGSLLEGKTADGTELLMIWRRTSRYDAAKMRWVPVGFWSSHLTRAPLEVEPISWRRPEGFSTPGQIVA